LSQRISHEKGVYEATEERKTSLKDESEIAETEKSVTSLTAAISTHVNNTASNENEALETVFEDASENSPLDGSDEVIVTGGVIHIFAYEVYATARYADVIKFLTVPLAGPQVESTESANPRRTSSDSAA